MRLVVVHGGGPQISHAARHEVQNALSATL
jgi:acetylglutamate kinase